MRDAAVDVFPRAAGLAEVVPFARGKGEGGRWVVRGGEGDGEERGGIGGRGGGGGGVVRYDGGDGVEEEAEGGLFWWEGVSV